MKCELLDYWFVLDFDVTGLLDIDLPGECLIGDKELDLPVECAKNFLFIYFIYLQSIIVSMPILMYV